MHHVPRNIPWNRRGGDEQVDQWTAAGPLENYFRSCRRSRFDQFAGDPPCPSPSINPHMIYSLCSSHVQCENVLWALLMTHVLLWSLRLTGLGTHLVRQDAVSAGIERPGPPVSGGSLVARGKWELGVRRMIGRCIARYFSCNVSLNPEYFTNPALLFSKHSNFFLDPWSVGDT